MEIAYQIAGDLYLLAIAKGSRRKEIYRQLHSRSEIRLALEKAKKARKRTPLTPP
jgi:hypothetical protein